jgi:hypothetical protein
VDYGDFKKKLVLPAGFAAPRELVYDDLVASPLTREHLADDLHGVNTSVDLIRRTRGGPWPAGPVTEDFDCDDLVWHELEFRSESSFAYVVYTDDGEYVGCFYLYPLGGRTQLTEELLEYDVDVSWWVVPSAYERGDYSKLYGALQHWLANEFPFWRPYYSNIEIPS